MAEPEIDRPAPGHRIQQRNPGVGPGGPLGVENRPPPIPQALLRLRCGPLIAYPFPRRAAPGPDAVAQEVKALPRRDHPGRLRVGPTISS